MLAVEKVRIELWKKFLSDIRAVASGLDNFGKEVDLEDEFETTFKEFDEKISGLVEMIEQRFNRDMFDHEFLRELADHIYDAHAELRLRQHDIWQGVIRRVSNSRFREAFTIAQQELPKCGSRIIEALDKATEEMTSEVEQVVEGA
jgi:hypothetical protein